MISHPARYPDINMIRTRIRGENDDSSRQAMLRDIQGSLFAVSTKHVSYATYRSIHIGKPYNFHLRDPI